MASRKVLFNASKDEILVEMVAKYPCIFDSACETYKNHVLKDNAWEEVAEAVARPVDLCKKRWRNIKDTYYKRQKKHGTSSTPCKWALYDSLSFLDKTNYQRNSTSKIKSTDLVSPKIEFMVVNEDEAEESDGVLEEPASNGEKNASTSASGDEEISWPNVSAAPSNSKRQRRSKLVGYFEKGRNKRLGKFKSWNQNQEDDVDLFFRSIAMSVKKLRPDLVSEAKIKSLQMVCELETRNGSFSSPKCYELSTR